MALQLCLVLLASSIVHAESPQEVAKMLTEWSSWFSIERKAFLKIDHETATTPPSKGAQTSSASLTASSVAMWFMSVAVITFLTFLIH
ncbi:hypothetical protein TcWFU_006137 [Taenia crassiceps]|uniref:Uncharacterized protein n=1 Tax=Taenia crassiceps TaxID=6207 RepID=A0ABR4Q0H4_9CEST